MYSPSRRSLDRLRGVHPLLAAVVLLAMRKYAAKDFTVLEGVRDMARQRRLVKSGKSQTLKSRHLKQQDGWGHAVDLAPLIGGDIPWSDADAFARLNEEVQLAADEMGVRVTWGGSWTSFYDGPHFQLDGVQGVER